MSRTLGDSKGLGDFSAKGTTLSAVRTPKANPKMDSIVQVNIVNIAAIRNLRADTKIAYRCNVDMVPLALP